MKTVLVKVEVPRTYVVKEKAAKVVVEKVIHKAIRYGVAGPKGEEGKQGTPGPSGVAANANYETLAPGERLSLDEIHTEIHKSAIWSVSGRNINGYYGAKINGHYNGSDVDYVKYEIIGNLALSIDPVIENGYMKLYVINNQQIEIQASAIRIISH